MTCGPVERTAERIVTGEITSYSSFRSHADEPAHAQVSSLPPARAMKGSCLLRVLPAGNRGSPGTLFSIAPVSRNAGAVAPAAADTYDDRGGHGGHEDSRDGIG